MLYLISLGLEEGDITLKAIERAKQCEKLYLEVYTSLGPSKEYLENLFNKKIIELQRSDVESSKIVNEAKKSNIGLLIYGDALSATTHISLIQECKENNIFYEIIHGLSILTLVSNTGLSLYKFGKTASIPFIESDTPYEILKQNKDAHTLFLLDLDPINNRYLTINQAIEYLMKKGMKDKLVVACMKLGTKEEKIIAARASELLKYRFDKFPQCLIVPGKLHFVEEEFLATFNTLSKIWG